MPAPAPVVQQSDMRWTIDAQPKPAESVIDIVAFLRLRAL